MHLHEASSPAFYASGMPKMPDKTGLASESLARLAADLFVLHLNFARYLWQIWAILSFCIACFA